MDTLTKNKQLTNIIDIIHINENTFKLKLERNDIEFTPGQHVYLGFEGERASREYSIYSSVTEQHLEFLIKTVDEGKFTNRLSKLKVGDKITIQGPYGFFTLPEFKENQEHIFIATGTGIAPFHSMIMSHPGLNYKIIHGIRNTSDVYDIKDYKGSNRIVCISREKSNHFNGRLTDYLKGQQYSPDAQYYLCGNSNMIEEVQDILEDRGINPLNIKTEVYF